jgi:hypothetical protein
MTTVTEIPLTPTPQTFGITLSGIAYRMKLIWREAGGAGWVLDIADGNGIAIVCGIPLVTGVDLLAAYPDKGFGGQLRVLTDGGADAAPTFANLGVTSHLYWLTQ